MTKQEVIKQLNNLIYNEKILVGCSTIKHQHNNNIEALEIAKKIIEESDINK